MEHDVRPLSELPVGSSARVKALLSGGAERRRMLDLGLVEGTRVEALYQSPFGDPIAYLIRGAVIALRSDLSGRIVVSGR